MNIIQASDFFEKLLGETDKRREIRFTETL